MTTTLRTFLLSLGLAFGLACGGVSDERDTEATADVETTEQGIFGAYYRPCPMGDGTSGTGVDCIPRALPTYLPEGAGSTCTLMCFYASAPGQVCRWSWFPPTLTCCSCDCQDVYACHSK